MSVEKQTLSESPYRPDLYESIRTDLIGAGAIERMELVFLEHGLHSRPEPEVWEHSLPSCDRLFLFNNLGAEVVSGNNVKVLSTGQIHLLPEGVPFTINYHGGSDLCFYHLRCFDGIHLPMFRLVSQPLSLDSPELFAAIFAATKQGDRVAMRCRVLECILGFIEKNHSLLPTIHPGAGRFQRLFAHLHDHLSPETRITDLADLMDMQSSALSKAFQRTFGLPLKNYLQTLQVARAKQELLFGERSIEQVALILGYKDPYYFNRVFKQLTGISPGRFRAQNRERHH